MEHHIMKIPMTKDIFDELDDAFIDQKTTSHDFVWGIIRNLCKDAKIGKLNKVCAVNVIKDGKPIQDQIKLKGITLDEIKSNPDWIPKNMEKEDITYFEHKITDKTLEYLKLFASFTVLRHKKYVESLQKDNAKRIEKMLADKNTDQKVSKDAESSFIEQIDKFAKALPSCIEEVVFNATYPPIQLEVNKNIENSFNKENEEMYPKEEKPSK